MTQPTRTSGAAAHARGLARTLGEMAAAIDQARSMGLPVNVPEPLYRACLEIIDRYDPPAGPDDTEAETSPSSVRDANAQGHRAVAHRGPSARATRTARQPAASRMAGGASIDDVPLRRLIWQVLDPGEEFTVTDVVERLTELGGSWPANKVSNALGYWVARRRLARQRKGVYRYPVANDPFADLRDEDSQQEIPADRRATAPGKEKSSNDVQNRQRQAM